MLWNAIGRMTTLISLANVAFQFHGYLSRDVKPHQIYSSTQAARLIGVDRATVVRLAASGALRGRLVERNYRIPGDSSLDYLYGEQETEQAA